MLVVRAADRDPAFAVRATWIAGAIVVLWPILSLSQFAPARLFEETNWRVMRNFVAGFLPPATDSEFLGFLLTATLETLAIATAGIALALVLAAPLAYATAQSLTSARIGPGPGRRRLESLRQACRAIMLVLRAVPEVVWALLFVRALGLGAAAGVLALAITYGGMLGKVYTEILESTDTRPARALLESGSGRFAALIYGLLPGASQELASYTIYRWECAVRASVVMGFVGAGGLGQLMDQSLKMLSGGDVSSILIVFLLLVMLADALSAAIRRVLA